MENELKKTLDLVKSKTGKDVTVYLESLNKVYSTLGVTEMDFPDYKVSGIMQDENLNKTFFRFRYGAESALGCLDKTGEAEKLFASLFIAMMEKGSSKEGEPTRAESLKSIVLGESDDISLQKFMRKYGIPDIPCTAYILHTESGKITDVLNFLENFKSNRCDLAVSTDDLTCAYIRFQNAQISETEYQSLTDYGYLLVQSIAEELGISVKIGIGSSVKNFSEVATSYLQAVSALRMSSVFETKSEVSTYKEYVLIKMLEDIPKYKLQEFLDVLLEPEAKSIFGDEEMLTTAEEFLRNSLNVSETSRKLYMHRNTLAFRLNKIDRNTGLDIRKFQDAVTFKLVTILYKLLG